MTTKNEQNPYDLAITDLKAKREAIDSMILQLEQLKTLNVSSSPPLNNLHSPQTVKTEITEDTFFNMGTADAVRKYLEMTNRTPKTTKEIHTALTRGGSKTNEKSLYVIISREARDSSKGLVKVNKKWGLSSWYKTNK